MHPLLRGYVKAVIETTLADDQGARVAGELGQVERLVAAAPALGTTLTDTAVPVAARRGVVTDLLGRRVTPATLRLVVRIIDTESAPEIVVALHDVAELALQMHNHLVEGLDAEADEPLLGRTAARQMIAGYAAGVFEELPSLSDLDTVEDELFRFARVVESTPLLRSAMIDRGLPLSVRRGVVEELLRDRAHPATLRLVTEALAGRARDLVATLDWLVVQTAQARGWRVARVHTARPMEDEERAQLSGALERLAGAPVELQEFVDESLLGGATVQIGDLLVDATVRHRLEELEEHLLGAEGERRGAHD
ncbi:MAG TPA: F0F1 ATP synthase subunit delta [Acidimicrobiales bacterium]|nr:F0F1 ATP synthase subunit delta [Acidimicrobiales bacterium]